MMVGRPVRRAHDAAHPLRTARFEASDVRVVEEVARRARFAVENIRLTEAARREFSAREVQFRVIADSMPMLMWTTNPEGVTEWHNRRWHEYTGRPEDSRWMSVGAPPSGRHRADAPCVGGGHRNGARNFELEHRIRRADETYRWFLTARNAGTRYDGAIVRWYGTSTDVTKRGRAAHAASLLRIGAGAVRRPRSAATQDAAMHVVVPEFRILGVLNSSSMKNGDITGPRVTIATERKRAALANQIGNSMRVRARSSRKWASPQRSSRR